MSTWFQRNYKSSGWVHPTGRDHRNVDDSKAERTALPSAPCFRCGARGPCKHRQE